MIRRFCVLIHRWVGLTMAILLVIVGLTGSLLAFYPELERILNPQFYPEKSSGAPLGLGELAERAEALAPEGRVTMAFLEGNQGATMIRFDPNFHADGGTAPLSFDNIFLDPYTGEELARRKFGAISAGWENFMSFIYQLHYALAAGTFGIWALGICALIWTIDCFVSVYLTFPARRRKTVIEAPSSSAPYSSVAGRGHGWWSRWKPAWLIRWSKGGYKLNYDLHRAGGLWLWIPLLVFAWSSVYMNLWDTVYTWTTRAVMEYKAPWTELPLLEKPLDRPKLSWRQAQATGERLMAEQAALHGFTVERPVALRLLRDRGVYSYMTRTSRDIQDKRGRTQLFFDANTGDFRFLSLPSGQYNGNTATAWLYALHMANVFGTPYRIFVFVLGLAITMLSVTGVVIWLKKRNARRISQNRRRYLSADS